MIVESLIVAQSDWLPMTMATGAFKIVRPFTR
jgi:hypothetical protein